jgi:hypothetical protein
MQRTSQATWRGTLATGEGRVTTESGSLDGARYSLPTRFGNEIGTNAEELIAAAHAKRLAEISADERRVPTSPLSIGPRRAAGKTPRRRSASLL